MSSANQKQQTKGVVIIPVNVWRNEGIRLFGKDERNWKFKCPVCGNIQCAKDFKEYKERGASPSSAYSECIGRYAEKGRKAFGGNKTNAPKQPCDYASYGFLKVSPVSIATPKGNIINVFEFQGEKT